MTQRGLFGIIAATHKLNIMNCERERNDQVKSKAEGRLVKLEARIESTRARITEAKRILAGHETTLERRAEKGIEPGKTEEWAENKRVLIAKLEAQSLELNEKVDQVREELRRLLGFDPVRTAFEQLPPQFRGVGKGEWKGVRSSRFRTFQEIFTPPEARIVPNYKRRPSYSEWQKQPIDHCPVEPMLIPDWLVEEFELGDLEGLSEFEKLERKVELIPDVRELFKHLQPMEAYGIKTYRVMVLEGYDPKHDGKIVRAAGREYKKDMRRKKKRGEPRKEMQRFDSIYDAHRSMIHAERSYEDEDPKVHGIKARVEEIREDAARMRGDDPLRADIEKRIEAELKLLGDVDSHDKAEAAEIMRTVKDMRDILGRPNSGATRAQLVRAANLLSGRSSAIFKKLRWVNEDKRILNKVINQSRATMGRAHIATLMVCKGLREECGERELERRIKSVTDIDGLSVRPFISYADKLQEKMGNLTEALGKPSKVADAEAMNAHVACKAFMLQHERERILRDLAQSPNGTTISALLKRAEVLEKKISPKHPAIDLTGSAAYLDLCGKTGKIVKGLSKYSTMRLSEDERQDMYKRLKQYLEEIDFSEILEKL